MERGIDALAADPHLFQRDGILVHVTRSPGAAPVIRTISPANMRERLTAAAQWLKLMPQRKGEEQKGDIGGNWQRCIPPDNIVHACLHPGRCGDKIRVLLGIIETPALRPDGTAIEDPGYDAATGYLYEPSIDFPRIPDAGKLAVRGQEIGARALKALAEPFADFPFRSEGDRMACIAGVLNLLARPAILGAVPAVIVDASTPGSGKTMIVDCIAIQATGRSAPRMCFADDSDEVAKVLGACALQGERLIAFDNINVPFGGGPVDMALTAEDTTKFRTLGKSETPDQRWRTCMYGTANNATWRGDTFRRVLAPRLEPTVENPEERTGFAHEDLRAWVRENRGRLVCAGLTLLRAFYMAGKPRGAIKLWGSFEAWSQIVPAAIVWAGGADPMSCRPVADDESRDEERASVSTLLSAILRLQPEGGITCRALVDSLFTSERMRGEDRRPDEYDDAREAVEALTKCPPGKKPDANKLGYVLRKWRRRVIADRRLEAGTNRNGVAKWFVVERSSTKA